MTSPPLTLRARAVKPVTLVGESVVIALDVQIHRALSMESPELNRDRTAVDVIASSGETWTFTGEHHIVLHRIPRLERVGESFDVAEGRQWTAELDLFQYTLPPRAGAYRLRVRYRWGDTDDEQVATEPVDVRVAPATLRALGTQWFALAAPRDVLGLVRAVHDGASTRWLMHSAARHDPAVAMHCADLGAPPGDVLGAPVLAQLDDIAAFHFERVIAWARADGLGWMTAQIRGRVRNPAVVPHGLPVNTPARLVEPPLQPRAEGVAAVLLVGDRGAVSLRVHLDGAVDRAHAGFDSGDIEHAVTTWGADETPTLWSVSRDGSVWRTTFPDGGRTRVGDLGDAIVHGIYADTHRGAGRVMALSARGAHFTVTAWELADEPPVGIPLGAWDVAQHGIDPASWMQAAPRDEGRGLVLLFRGDDAWVVLSAAGVGRVLLRELPAEGVPRLVVNARDRVFLVGHHPDVGVFSARVSIAPESP